MIDPDGKADPGAAERGHPATVAKDGSVHGSGAGTGGGAPEDFDSDPASGSEGDIEPRDPPPPGTGGDAAVHNSR